MKARAWALFFTVAVAATSARAQGTFQNLDFEAARVDSGLLSNWAVNLLAASDAWPRMVRVLQYLSIIYDQRI